MKQEKVNECIYCDGKKVVFVLYNNKKIFSCQECHNKWEENVEVNENG